jgi:hypothetical protein
MSENKSCKCHKNSTSCTFYGLGVIGAAVYYFQQATTFGLVIMGIIKAVFWPAFVLYKILGLLQM